MGKELRILVTGASGFIGNRLCSVLEADGYDVARVSSADFRSSKLSLEFKRESFIQLHGAILDYQPTTIFHLATKFVGQHSFSDIEGMSSANIEFSTVIADAASQVGSRFIYTNSAWQRFEGRVSAVSLYAAFKEGFARILDYYREVHALGTQQVFLYDTYGPNDGRGKVVQRLVESTVSGVPVQLGSSSKLINLTHVDDVVNGLIRLSHEANLRQDWVIRADKAISLLELSKTIAVALDVNPVVEWGSQPDRPREMWTDWDFGTRFSVPDAKSLIEGIKTL
jgi:nucleoside-diphosphate-sugar epimerase